MYWFVSGKQNPLVNLSSGISIYIFKNKNTAFLVFKVILNLKKYISFEHSKPKQWEIKNWNLRQALKTKYYDEMGTKWKQWIMQIVWISIVFPSQTQTDKLVHKTGTHCFPSFRLHHTDGSVYLATEIFKKGFHILNIGWLFFWNCFF